MFAVLRTEYFFAGLGITESIKFHCDQLEMAEDFSPSTLADATENPSYRTVRWWYDVWRIENLGTRTGVGMIEVSMFKRSLIVLLPKNSFTCKLREILVIIQANKIKLIAMTVTGKLYINFSQANLQKLF